MDIRNLYRELPEPTLLLNNRCLPLLKNMGGAKGEFFWNERELMMDDLSYGGFLALKNNDYIVGLCAHNLFGCCGTGIFGHYRIIRESIMNCLSKERKEYAEKLIVELFAFMFNKMKFSNIIMTSYQGDKFLHKVMDIGGKELHKCRNHNEGSILKTITLQRNEFYKNYCNISNLLDDESKDRVQSSVQKEQGEVAG